MDNFVTRLEYILEFYELTASAFADKIGVQRSSLSHLLSGRNKPSLDFILKVKEAFPTLEFDWLLKGEGSFSSENMQQNFQGDMTNPATKDSGIPPSDSFSNMTKERNDNLTPPSEKNNFMHIIAGNDITQIIVFYQDGTFTNFKPRQ